MLPFFLMFEKRRPHAREVVMIAVLVVLAVISRTIFFMIPFFKPMLAMVIISGIGLGPQCGLLVGTLSAFISNFAFGQGPWTIWQMPAMGLCGLLAGLLFAGRYRFSMIYRIMASLYGLAAAVLIYGLIMDTYSAIAYTGKVSKELLITMYISGLPVNLMHAASTLIFIWLLTPGIVKKLRRIKLKYDF